MTGIKDLQEYNKVLRKNKMRILEVRAELQAVDIGSEIPIIAEFAAKNLCVTISDMRIIEERTKQC